MNDFNLIKTIYKNLNYACFLNLSENRDRDEFFKERNWECINININPAKLQSVFDTSLPTIFHYTWVGKEYKDSVLDSINASTINDGWQKRFIVIGFEEITPNLEKRLLDLYYSKINNCDGNFYIHKFYEHYINRQ